MFRNLLIFIVFFLAAGCAFKTPVAAGPEAAAVAEPVEVPVVAVVEPAPVDRTPDACEMLLKSLEQTMPLLTTLDETLVTQADRVELAVGRMQQPAAEPRAPECPAGSGNPIGNKEVIGAMEWLYIDPPGSHYRARVDSGAETSSLSASDVEEFERDGEDWVRFTFQHEDSEEKVEIELPIVRTVLVRQLSSDDRERRFVVELDIRLGNQLQSTEFTLTDRSNMAYPVSLGRAFLMDLYVVDVSRSYTQDRYDAS
jgi:hypothetical protein